MRCDVCGPVKAEAPIVFCAPCALRDEMGNAVSAAIKLGEIFLYELTGGDISVTEVMVLLSTVPRRHGVSLHVSDHVPGRVQVLAVFDRSVLEADRLRVIAWLKPFVASAIAAGLAQR